MPVRRRIVMASAVSGAGLVALLTVAHRDTVRDHLEAWRFQLARMTETIDPPPPGRTAAISSPLTVRERASAYRQGPSVLTGREAHSALFKGFISVAAHELRSSVVFDPAEVPPFLTGPQMPRTVCNIRGLLARSGYRLIEQRIPRRAYVMVRDEPGVPGAPRGAVARGPRS